MFECAHREMAMAKDRKESDSRCKKVATTASGYSQTLKLINSVWLWLWWYRDCHQKPDYACVFLFVLEI